MEFVFCNNITGTYVVFDSVSNLDNLKNEPEKAISAVVSEMLLYGAHNNQSGLQFPAPLLENLEDEEIDMILMASYDDYFRKMLMKMIFVPVVDENRYVTNGIDDAIFNIEAKGILFSIITSCSSEGKTAVTYSDNLIKLLQI